MVASSARIECPHSGQLPRPAGMSLRLTRRDPRLRGTGFLFALLLADLP
jgi:hypothetical protein